MSISPSVAIEPGTGPIVAARSARASILVIEGEAIVFSTLHAMLKKEAA